MTEFEDPRGRIVVRKYEPSAESLNAYASHIHELNKIWWYSPEGLRLELDPGERYMLIVSELAEAMEGSRKSLMDDHLTQYPTVWVELADCVIRILDCASAWGLCLALPTIHSILDPNPQTVAGRLLNIVDIVIAAATCRLWRGAFHDKEGEGEELALVVHYCVKLAEQLDCEDFWQVVYAKLLYNQKRQDHSYAARAASGGKKF